MLPASAWIFMVLRHCGRASTTVTHYQCDVAKNRQCPPFVTGRLCAACHGTVVPVCTRDARARRSGPRMHQNYGPFPSQLNGFPTLSLIRAFGLLRGGGGEGEVGGEREKRGEGIRMQFGDNIDIF